MARTVEIVYPVCCGMDVHKSFIVACVAVTDEQRHTEHHIRRFSTFKGDLWRLASWLAAFNCCDVCMESAGKYWIPVFNTLEKSGINVCLTHPKYVKAIKGYDKCSALDKDFAEAGIRKSGAVRSHEQMCLVKKWSNRRYPHNF